MFDRAITPDLDGADPGVLLKLADFFTYQAEQCRSAAAEQQRRARAKEQAARMRADARKRFLRCGARLAALARLRGSLESAKAVMVNRGDWTIEQLGFAHAAWQRLRADRRRRIRDAEIWKAKLAGMSTRELAKHYRLTARQIDKIAAAYPSQSVERSL